MKRNNWICLKGDYCLNTIEYCPNTIIEAFQNSDVSIMALEVILIQGISVMKKEVLEPTYLRKNPGRVSVEIRRVIS